MIPLRSLFKDRLFLRRADVRAIAPRSCFSPGPPVVRGSIRVHGQWGHIALARSFCCPAHSKSRLTSLDRSTVCVAESRCAEQLRRGPTHGQRSTAWSAASSAEQCRAEQLLHCSAPWSAVPAGPAAGGAVQSIRLQKDHAESLMAKFSAWPPESARRCP
jgi:hypothetical protein